MKIGIIGAGHIGGNLGIHLAQAGHEIFFGSRHPKKLKKLAENAGNNSKYGTLKQASEFGDLLILSIPFGAVEEVAHDLGGLNGKTIIETTNPYPERDGKVAHKIRKSSQAASVYVASQFPKAHVIKAFNTIYFEHLKNQANRTGKLRAIPYAGDHQPSLEQVESLIKEIGFDPVYVGKLSESHLMDVDQPLYNVDLTAEKVHQILRKSKNEFIPVK